ncbi:MAG: hypothetical protein ABIE36_01740 [Candidatus Diapherotrites archaeon]
MKATNQLTRFLAIVISIVVFFILAFAGEALAQAQTENLKQKDTLTNEKSTWEGLSLTFLTGETALTDGNTLMAVWKKGKSVLIADINDELGEFMYFYYPKKWFSIGPSAGFLWGSPYIGPIGTIELYKNNFSFKTLDWFGWNLGNSIDECSFLFSFHQFTFGYEFKNKVALETYYILQHFQKNSPEHIPGIKLTFKLNNSWSVFGGGAYMVHKDYHLWSCGINFNLNK